MSSEDVAEGDIDVPGGRLHYRLSGAARAGQTIVLENGWSGSFPYMVWLERALASQARVLAYDRVGVGYSRADAAPTTAGLTQQLVALLDALQLREPVTIVGHSYGGLLAVLHKVQAPERVRALVQIDPTPEFEDPLIDASLRIVPRLGRVMQLLALLRLDHKLMPELAQQLPAEVLARLQPGTGWTLRSLNGAIAEIGLLAEVRRTVSSSERASQAARLVISAAPAIATPTSWLARRFAKPGQAQRFTAAAHALHRRQAALHPASAWTTLPYSHVGLIVDRASAALIADRTLEFLRNPAHGI